MTALGVDEIAWRHGHNYLTLVYQIDAGNTRLLWIGQDRTMKTLLRFFHFFGEQRSLNYEPVLKNSRWCLLKRKEDLTEKQKASSSIY